MLSWGNRDHYHKASKLRTNDAANEGSSCGSLDALTWRWLRQIDNENDCRRKHKHPWCWTVGEVCPICHEWMILWSGCHRLSFGSRRISRRWLDKHWSDQVTRQESIYGCGIRFSLSNIDRQSLIIILMTASSIWKKYRETCDVFPAQVFPRLKTFLLRSAFRQFLSIF